MGKYTTKITDDEGNASWESTDGSIHKTRKKAWEHSKSSIPEEEREVTQEPDIEVDDNYPQWASFDFGVQDGDTVEVIPSALKRIKGTQNDGVKKTKKQLEVERQNNLALLTMSYRTTDHLMTNYKRALLEDPNAEAIKHSSEDYLWISEITDSALQDNGISIQSVVSPTLYAGAANLYWFGVPLSRITKESGKNPFKGRLGGVGRMLERLPIIGKRLKSRRLEKSLQTVEGGYNAESP